MAGITTLFFRIPLLYSQETHPDTITNHNRHWIEMAQKCILILLDGIGDRSYDIFQNQTPLQAARTPNLDRIAAQSATGMYHASWIGQALPSENAHFIMFGYDLDQFPGRGALEALGAGIELEESDVAVLSHFISVRESDNCLFLEENKPSVTPAEIQTLAKEIRTFSSNGLSVRFTPTGGIRGIVTIRGNASRFITDSDPFANQKPLVDIQPWSDFKDDAAAINTARVLKEYLIHAFRVLSRHPVNQTRRRSQKLPLNGLNTQRAGQLRPRELFRNKYGLSGLIMASGLVYKGLGSYLGFAVEPVKDSGDPGRDIAERIKSAHSLLNTYDFIHVHTKTPDEAAHTKDPRLKKEVIESLDAGIGEAVQPLLDDPEVLTVITADHSTPSCGPLIHSGESVPLLFHGNGVRLDTVNRFNEVDASTGCLGTIRGKELILLILNHLDRAKLVGIMDSPVDRPYWPGNAQPLLLQNDIWSK